jgi:cytochrome oxidase Cu insertion factor (SCO1/SenC/PrrC family)
VKKRWQIAILLVLTALPATSFILRGMSRAPAQPKPAAVPVQPIPGLPGLGGPFTLTDQDGKTRTDQEFRGKLLLVTFGFTGCSSICPLQMQKVSEALAEIPPDVASRVVPLFISIDPIGDTPQGMRRFLAAYHPSIIGLTGSEAQIDTLLHDYHVHIGDRASASETGDIEHSDMQYLMGPDGNFLTLILPNASASDIAARLGKYAAGTLRPA